MQEFKLLNVCGGRPKVIKSCDVRKVELYMDDFIDVSKSSMNETMAQRLAEEGDYLCKQGT